MRNRFAKPLCAEMVKELQRNWMMIRTAMMATQFQATDAQLPVRSNAVSYALQHLLRAPKIARKSAETERLDLMKSVMTIIGIMVTGVQMLAR